MIEDITAMINAKGADLARAIGNIVDRFAPGVGSIIGAFGSLIAKIFGKKKEPLEVKQVEPIVIAPENLSIGLGAAPTGMVYGNRFVPTGAGFQMDINMNDGVSDFIELAITERLQGLNESEGVL